MQVLLVTCGSWYLGNTAAAFAARNSLAGLWTSERTRAPLPPGAWRQCRPFHLAMQPFYRAGSQIAIERMFYRFFPLWRGWARRQPPPAADVVQAIMGFGTEAFDHADQSGALKVLDCPNSHPTSYYGYWQRECDLWCPGERVPIPPWMFARMNRELERADLVLCPSNFVRDTMLANGVPAAKCVVNPFGVDTSTFTPRAQPPTAPRFIAVGTICVRKGYQYLFRAFEQLKRELPAAELVVVGQYKTDFRLERPRWEGTFTHYPSLGHAQLAEVLRSATAFVMPSLEEGFARVIVEAMASGLPILASYESGATTLVQDGREGLIIPPREPAKLAAAMLQVATDLALNRALGEAAHRKGGVRNTWQDYGDRLLAEYRQRHGPQV